MAVPFMRKKPAHYDVLVINELMATRPLVKKAKNLGLNVFISCVWGLRNIKSLHSLESDGIYINIQ
ncbi:MAG: hypothetical protein JW860_05385 [Sedimentisphaerales bacterium]|nr:hypothetical protein [Sedimentisphaerales bacterium]